MSRKVSIHAIEKAIDQFDITIRQQTRQEIQCPDAPNPHDVSYLAAKSHLLELIGQYGGANADETDTKNSAAASPAGRAVQTSRGARGMPLVQARGRAVFNDDSLDDD